MNLMAKAWEIARKGQNQFGGNVKEYFAQALKMAWSIVKGEKFAMEAKEMNKPSYDEVIKLVNETKEAATSYHKMNEQSKVTPFGPREGIELERLARRASDLNKKRKEVLSLFTTDELNEIRKIAQKG